AWRRPSWSAARRTALARTASGAGAAFGKAVMARSIICAPCTYYVSYVQLAQSMGASARHRKPLCAAARAAGRRLVAEILVLQRQLDVRLAQQGDCLLQVVALLARHPQLVPIDLGLDFEFGLLDGGDQLLGHALLDALADGDLLACAAQVFQGIGRVHAAHVDAARREPAAQDVEHLLQLEGAGRRLGDDVALQFEARIRSL